MTQIVLARPSANSARLPRGVLLGAAALVGFALLASGFARVSDVGTLHMPARQAVETLALRFEDQADGGVLVRDARDGVAIYTVAPGSNGFIRATMRGLVRERKRSGIDGQPPFALTRWGDGTLSLSDAATGRDIALDAFGPTNSQAFAHLFEDRRQHP